MNFYIVCTLGGALDETAYGLPEVVASILNNPDDYKNGKYELHADLRAAKQAQERYDLMIKVKELINDMDLTDLKTLHEWLENGT